MPSVPILATLVTVIVTARAPAPATQPAAFAYDQTGPHEIASLKFDWHDADRDRPVPARVHYPADEESPFPIVIFSHGLGGSCEGYAYLGRHWANHGYVAVHLDHEGSNADVWRGRNDASEQMQRAAKDPQNAINRPKDVSFAIDQLKELSAQDGPLKDRLDLNRIAVAGHSFGAFTALAVAGEAGTHAPDGPTLADRRVKAAIPMSAPVPVRRDRYDLVYGQIAIPCLHMTGTLDESPVAFTKAEDRRIPYDYITGADQYLVTFIGGDHAIFTGRVRRGPHAEKDRKFQNLIRLSTTAFLEAHLKGDEKTQEWLQTGGLKAALGSDARLEQKRPATQPAETGQPRMEKRSPLRPGEPARPARRGDSRPGVRRNR